MRYPCSSHASPVSHVLAPPSPLTTKLGNVAATLAFRFDCLRTLCLARVPNATSCLAYFFVLFGFASLCASRMPYLPLISLRLGLLRAPCPHCYLLLVCFFGMFPFFYLVISTSPCSSVLCSRLTHICASLFYFPLSAWASCPFRRITFTSVHHDLQATRS